jgi:hypothetical protein
MEECSTGVMQCGLSEQVLTNTPTLQYSNTPDLHVISSYSGTMSAVNSSIPS